MPINEVTIVSCCGECGTEIETVTVKKDNMMLSTSELAWCSKCQADRPQVRDVAGHSTVDIRQECIQFLEGPLTGKFNAAICQVTHETGHLECPGDNERGISKTDSLDIATIKHLAAFLLSILDHPASSPDQNPDWLISTLS